MQPFQLFSCSSSSLAITAQLHQQGSNLSSDSLAALQPCSHAAVQPCSLAAPGNHPAALTPYGLAIPTKNPASTPQISTTASQPSHQPKAQDTNILPKKKLCSCSYYMYKRVGITHMYIRMSCNVASGAAGTACKLAIVLSQWLCQWP